MCCVLCLTGCCVLNMIWGVGIDDGFRQGNTAGVWLGVLDALAQLPAASPAQPAVRALAAAADRKVLRSAHDDLSVAVQSAFAIGKRDENSEAGAAGSSEAEAEPIEQLQVAVFRAKEVALAAGFDLEVGSLATDLSETVP